MSGGGYDDDGRWVWNCSCDPGPEGQHQWYCASLDDGPYEGPVFITVDASPPKPPYGTPERAAWDAERQA